MKIIAPYQKRWIKAPITLYTEGVTLNFTLNTATPISYHIHDVLGKEVQQKQLGQLSMGEQNIPIHVRDLPNGIWFLSLKTDNQIFDTKKFVVQR